MKLRDRVDGFLFASSLPLLSQLKIDTFGLKPRMEIDTHQEAIESARSERKRV